MDRLHRRDDDTRISPLSPHLLGFSLVRDESTLYVQKI